MWDRVRTASPSRGCAGAGSSSLVAAGCGVVRAGRAFVFCVVRPPTTLLHFNFG